MAAKQFAVSAGALFGVASAAIGVYGAWKAATAAAAAAKAKKAAGGATDSKPTATAVATAAAPVAQPTFAGVLFDLDGTLIETGEIWYLVLRAASQHWGYGDLPRAKWAPTFGQSMEANVSAFFPRHTVAALDAFVDAHYDQFIAEHLVVLPGARDLLRTAYERTGGRVVCVTNCPQALTARLLHHCGFDAYFRADRVVCSGMTVAGGGAVIPPKPDPTGCLHACALLGLAPAQCVLIGDSKFDVAAGKAAGVGTIGIGVDGALARVAKTAQVLDVLEPRLPAASAASAAVKA